MHNLDKKITENLYRRGQSSFGFWSVLSRYGFGLLALATVINNIARLSLAAVTISLLIVLILQELTRRNRPNFLASPYKPFALRWSWPSGHAAVAFAWGLLFFTVSPIWGALAMVFALLIAVSRIFLGVHYFSDVLSGALLGLMVSGTLLWL